MNWIIANLGTILIASALLVVVTLIVVSMIRNKRKNPNRCASGCSGCSGGCGIK